MFGYINKIRLKLFFVFLVLIGNNLSAQVGCPSYPSYGRFDPLCFIPSNLPDNSTKGTGLWLAEGAFYGKYGEFPMHAYIPDNRPTWAISIAHAWNYSRNIAGTVDNPKMSYWLSTTIQENGMACDANATWSGGRTPWGINYLGKVTAGAEDGCFQIEGVNNGSAYGALMQYYPLRFRANEHPNIIGTDNFETSALTKAYYDLFTKRIAVYRWGWDFYGAVANTCDPYAHDKLTASCYNAGIYAFQGAAAFMAGQEANCYWTGLPATTAGYATMVGDMISVLENDFTYPVTTFNQAQSTFAGYYNQPMSWSNVEDYFTIISSLYHEINFATQVRPSVMEAFIEVAGDINATIPFTQFGPVIDAIILALPREDPIGSALSNDGTPRGPQNNTRCLGQVVPFSRIEAKGDISFCEGLSVDLEAVVEGGGGANPSYTWYVNGVEVSTDRVYNFTNTIGVYEVSLRVCNGTACNFADCSINIEVKDCGGCGMIANTTTTPTPCKSVKEGGINVAITGGVGPWEILFTGPVNGLVNTVNPNIDILNIPDGYYNLIITDANGCEAYANALVDYVTLINEIVDASTLSIVDCKAELEAEIKEFPSPCLWKVRAYVPVFFQWEPAVNFIVSPQSGGAQFLQWNRMAMRPEIDPWNDVQLSESFYTLYSGDVLNFDFSVTNTPGATMQRAYRVEVYDPNDVLVQTFNAPAGSATALQPYRAGSYTVNCPYNAPAYDFTWAPPINDQTDTPVKSNGNVNVSPNNDITYTVTAINQSNPQCRLTDTVTVKRDPNCVPTCTLPTATFTGLSASPLSICQGTSTSLNALINGGAGSLVYQWYNGVTAIGTPQNFTAGANVNADLTAVNTAGTYTLRVAEEASGLNESGCFIESTAIIVTIEQLPDAPSTNPLSACLNTTAPALSATGTMGATFTWYDAQTNGTAYPGVPTLSTTTAGTTSYWVSQTVNGCESNRSELVYTVHNLPTVNATSDATNDAICIGQSVTLTGSGTATTYTWDNSVTNNSAFTPTTTATYIVTGIDANNCENTDQITITVNDLPTVNATSDAVNDAICEGQAVTLTGTGTATTYNWTNSVTDNTAFVPSITATYTVTGVDANGCEDTDQITITINELPAATISGTNTICNGSNTPIEISFTAGQPDFAFTYNGSVSGNVTVTDHSSSTYQFTANTAQTFTLVSVTDANGCEAASLNSSASVSFHQTLTATSSLVCGANAQGGVTLNANQFQIIIEITGGTASNVTADQGAITFTEIAPNRWASNAIDESLVVEATVVDANVCSNVVLSGLTQQCSCPATGTLTLFSGNNTICPGGFAELSLSFGGGTGDYDLTLNGGSTPQVFNGVSASPQQINISEAGNYTATVRSIDDNCTITVAENIQINHYTVPQAEISGDISVCDVPGAVGQIEVELTGTAPWNIEYSDGTITTTVTGIMTSPHTLEVGVGNYELISVTDNHCVGDVAGTASVNAVQTPVATITTPATSIQYVNVDNYQLEAAPLSGAYTGTWSIITGQGSINNTGNLTGLTDIELGGGQGTTLVRYTVNDDDNLCTPAFTEVTIIRRDITLPDAGADHVMCASDLPYIRLGNGDQTLTAVEDYRWIDLSGVAIINDNQIEIPLGTPAGRYTFTFEITNNDAAVTNTNDFVLTIDALPSVATVGTTIITCANTVNLNATQPIIGTGEWTIANGQGVLANALSPTTVLNDLLLENQTTDLVWTVSNGVCTPSTATLQVQKAGAITTPSIAINGNIISDTEYPMCVDEAYTITSNTPAVDEDGEWISGFTGANTTQNYTPTSAGTNIITWRITNTSGSGCAPEDKTIELIIRDVPDISTAQLTYQDGCEGTDVNASVSDVVNADSYTWHVVNNATLISSLDNNAVYRLTDDGSTISEIRVEAINQCGNASITQINVIQTKPDNAGGRIDGITAPVLCGNIGQLEFSAEDFIDAANILDYRWVWNGNVLGTGASITLPNTEFGSGGEIDVIPFNQCGEGNAITETISIITPENLSVTLQIEDQGGDRRICLSEGEVRFQAIPSNANTADFANNQYEFVHVRNNTMIGTSIGDPFSDNVPVADLRHGDVIQVQLTAPSGGCYAGTSTVSNTLTVDGYQLPSIDYNANRTEMCEEDQGNIVLTALPNKGDDIYTWIRTDENGNEFTVGSTSVLTLNQPAQSGYYHLITDNAVCGQIVTNSQWIKIYEQPQLLLEDKLTIEIIQGASGQLKVLSTGLFNDTLTSIEWLGSYINDASILQPLIIPEGRFEGIFPYTLTVQTGRGNAICTDIATIDVLFKLPLNIPNAFTPNGDNENDTWIIDGILDFPKANVYVFNRWGYKIYQQLGGYVTPWDGRHYKSGALQEIGTFYYIIELNDYEKTVKTGDVTILR